mgnify:CR=1 FL=1
MKKNSNMSGGSDDRFVPIAPSDFEEEGLEVQSLRPFGVGLDVHRLFIQVSVIVKRDNRYYEYQKEFKTTWDDVCKAKEWVISTIETKSDPPFKIDDSVPFRYCLESTGQYHEIVLRAWLGEPELINPLLAGATLKKTDVADASKLARMSLSGVWRTYYVPSDDIRELRALIAERSSYGLIATRTSNRINSMLLRFGITIGREGSVTKSGKVRNVVENLIWDSSDEEDEPIMEPDAVDLEEADFDISLCPDGLPDSIKELIREEYDTYDDAIAMRDCFQRKVTEKVLSMKWETKDSSLDGEEMLKLLGTVPGIAQVTGCIWLANIITPRRFPNAKACSAYCGLDPSVQISAKHVTGKKMRKGNKDLHSALTVAASNLINRHSEPIGRWGYKLYLQTGRWKKATNAVARRLAVSMYQVQLRGEVFSYDKYNLIKQANVIDMPMEDLVRLKPEFNRYVRILKENGIETTSQMVQAYETFTLTKMKGLGKKFYSLVQDFIDNQKDYKARYDKAKAAPDKKER